MVHNGIEYGDMQLICEAYFMLKEALGLSNDELYDVFAEWNRGELDSYLIEITRDIFSVKDEEGGELPGRQDSRHGRRQGDRQVDEPACARPGRAQHAGDRGRVCPRPVGDERRARAGQQGAQGPERQPEYSGDRKQFIEQVRQALYASKICSYAQGFVQLAGGGRGAQLAAELRRRSRCCGAAAASSGRGSSSGSRKLRRRPKLENLLLAPYFPEATDKAQDAWRHVIVTAAQLGIWVPAFTTALAYYDGYPPRAAARQPAASPARLLRRPHLPADRRDGHVPHGLDPRAARARIMIFHVRLAMANDYLEKLFGLSGQTAVVIGGTGVLGGALAEGLAQAGAVCHRRGPRRGARRGAGRSHREARRRRRHFCRSM